MGNGLMVFIELPPNYFIENGRKDGHYIDICYRLALNVWLSHGENDEDVCDDSVLETIEENDAQVNDAFKLPYLEKDYFPKDGIHPHLYYLSIDLEKFYQTVSMDKIRNKLLSAFSVDNPMLTALINSITKFEVVNEGNGRIPFTDEELKEMDLPSDLAFDGLPTGLIVAGALANLYILDVDLKVCEKLKMSIRIIYYILGMLMIICSFPKMLKS